MPRTKRTERFSKKMCLNCHVEFFPVRSDALTCGVVCRQQMSRKCRSAKKTKPLDAGLKAKGKIECSSCGTKIDGRVARCPVCGAKEKKLASKSRHR